MDYLELEIKAFKEFHNNGCIAYFMNTEHYSLISIPNWNWSYMWDFNKDDTIAKEGYIKVLSEPMFLDDAIEITERFFPIPFKKKVVLIFKVVGRGLLKDLAPFFIPLYGLF